VEPVPELPEVEAVRRELEPVLTDARIEAVEVRRPDLREPVPRGFSNRLEGQTVRSLERRAKYLMATLSSGETLLVHLGMSGAFEVIPPPRTQRTQPRRGAQERNAHDHVLLHLTSGATVVFNDPRRFGLMTLLTPSERVVHPVLSRLGPEPLSSEFDAHSLARALRGKKTSLKAALLDQRVVAGLGNIYASEALHLAALSPVRRASSIATPTGAPRATAYRLADAVKRVLTRAVARTTRAAYRLARFRVYDREGERCLRPGCRGVIRRRTQAGRSTFYCPVCQR
jgi:formamidopyrimidine-DNA glycosylase